MRSGHIHPLISLWFYIQRKISDNTAIAMNKLLNYQFFEGVLGTLLPTMVWMELRISKMDEW